MPSQESILTTELIDVLNEFKDAHALLSDCLEKDTAYPVWIQARPEPSESKAALKELVLNWSYEDNDQLAGKTLQYNGLAPCSKETLAAVELVNSTRLRLHKQLIRMDGFSLDEMGNDAVGLGR